MCLLAMNSVYSSNHGHTMKKRAMPGPNPVSLVAKQRHLSLKILRRKIWATAGNEPGSEALRYKNNKKCPLRADGPTRRTSVA